MTLATSAASTVALAVFVPFAVRYLQLPLKWDGLWATLCLVGTVHFIFLS